MKTANYLLALVLVVISLTSSAQSKEIDLGSFIGKWTLDLSPQDTTDSNFAMMEITSIDKKTVKGTFYREGVKIREGRVNLQLGIPYVALISEDGTGQYNSSFYMKDGELYGSTHAVDRGFLAVWKGTKESE